MGFAEIVAGVLVVFLVIRTGIALLNWLQHPGLGRFLAKERADYPLISLLIPARNEAATLPVLLPMLLDLTYPNFEVVVLNDQSEDETEAVLQQFSGKDSRLRYLNGLPLPAGWLGKNWACHQLSQEAKGAYFLFLDADIQEVKPAALTQALAGINQRKAALLSVFPDQEMITPGEWMVVPVMHYLLLSLLPLNWIWQLPFPSMAAANGQFMFFEGDMYRKHLWHSQARDRIVEDIAISQMIKKAGLKTTTVVADGLVTCRMYRTFAEGIQGFSKNLLAGFGNSIAGMLVYEVLVIVGWLFVAPSLPVALLLVCIGLILLQRTFISLLAHQRVLNNLILHPVQMGVMLILGAGSIIKRIRRRNTWKGRNVQLS